MPLYRRADSPFWWYSFTVKGARFRGSCETEERELAEIYETNLKRETQLGAITGQKPRATLDEAFALYYDRHAFKLPSERDIKRASRVLLAGLGKLTGLHQITDALVARYVAKRRGTMTQARMGRDAGGKPIHKLLAESSINRELTLLRSVLLKARDEWGMEVAPIRFKLHMLAEPEPRSRYLSSDEADKLMTGAAAHLRPAIRFALLTGLRLGNIIGLDWAQIDMRARQITFRVKSRKPGGKVHVLPITGDMLVLLANQGPAGKGPVFTYNGNAIGTWKRSWRTAKKRAGITDFRFHDLRHTAASWMVQGGAELDVVQEVLGHEDIATTQRYAHRDTDAKARAMEKAASRLGHAEDAAPPTASEKSKA
jgi:integrase